MMERDDNLLNDDLGPDPDGIFLEAGVAGLAEGAITGGVGLPEIALADEEQADMDRRELLVNPSDLQDVGDPEAGDVGVVGGLAAGAEMGLSGRDHDEADPWGLDLIEKTGVETSVGGLGGTGVVESEMAEFEEGQLEFEEEKM